MIFLFIRYIIRHVWSHLLSGKRTGRAALDFSPRFRPCVVPVLFPVGRSSPPVTAATCCWPRSLLPCRPFPGSVLPLDRKAAITTGLVGRDRISDDTGKMTLLSVSAMWDEIDISERYLVCCMFEEATALAASILHRVLCTPFEDAIDDVQSDEILVSASMVFIQSMKQSKRTEEIFVELRTLFGSVAAIPVQVFLTGACMQISEGYTSNLGPIFEEFLSKWKFVDDKMYILIDAEPQCSDNGSPKQFIMSPEKYLAVAEVYTITVLGQRFHNLNLAISWTEKAELPEESRQVLHRRLHSLLGAQRLEHPHSSSANGSMQIGDETYPKSRRQELPSDENRSIASSLKTAQPSKKIVDQIFQWFDTVRIKVVNVQLVLPRGKKLLFGSLIILAYYILRRKTTPLKRFVAGQASIVKGALVDAWRLAFSVQVNPLAAIQQLPSIPQGSAH